MLNQVVALLSERNSMALLGARINQQLLVNLLILWARRTIDEKGAEHLEQELAPIMAELELMVAASMKARGKEPDPAYLPEGFRSTGREEQGDEKKEEPDAGQDDDPLFYFKNPPLGW
ncbi:hypothetical protein SAMN05444166_5687 [Singulisphaera sp. GP187]|uniref:hypothetical protein n=1 Tax=Singulisphaera sp. GP187 TaxID=1882752 RepID=UPI00092C29D7|nr:hypothetical protein [Singulisphaera sp. GP187]SIO58461.1 hypothetical protein SAMN05444166_5687 [Singulisphaera sp. GP187]